jgi:hypothetical protein
MCHQYHVGPDGVCGRCGATDHEVSLPIRADRYCPLVGWTHCPAVPLTQSERKAF